MPHLEWQTSDLAENHAGVQAWINEAELANVLPPILLDMQAPRWPTKQFDAVYTANTCHIMSWPQVENMFDGVGTLLIPDGVFCVYGPFNYHGAFTSESNAQFDVSLRAQGTHRAIRNIEALQELAEKNRLLLRADHAMPANNRLLIFHRLGH